MPTACRTPTCSRAPASRSAAARTTTRRCCSTHGVNIYLDVMIKGLERLITAGDVLARSGSSTGRRTRARTSSSRATQEENEYIRQVDDGALRPEPSVHEDGDRRRRMRSNKIHRDALDDLPPQALHAPATRRSSSSATSTRSTPRSSSREHVRRLGHGHRRQAGRPDAVQAHGPGVHRRDEEQGRPAGHGHDRVPGAGRHRRSGRRAPRARRDAQRSAPRTFASSWARRTASTCRASADEGSVGVHPARRRGGRRHDRRRARRRVDQGAAREHRCAAQGRSLRRGLRARAPQAAQHAARPSRR